MMKNNTGKGYSFAQEPRAVGPRKKYRDPFQQTSTIPERSNIMWDRRVVRGNTYAAHPMPMPEQDYEAEKEKSLQRKRAAQKMRAQKAAQERRSTTPEPVEGRQHLSVQTEKYLEEIKDRLIEADVETQTDPFMDRPPSPLFIPPKTGIDRATQVEDGELFDFDYEVEPILEVLVGKTLEQSMMEVMEEEELAALKQHQEEFEKIRNAELAQTQRMEAAERRRWEEKERRKAQERERLVREKQAKEKLAAIQFSKNFLSNLEDSVFRQLATEGFFYDHVEREVEMQFMPWLMERVDANMHQKRNSRALTDDLIKAALKKCLMAAQSAKVQRKKREAEERVRQEEERRRQEEDAKKRRIEEIRRKEEEAAAAAATASVSVEDGDGDVDPDADD
eukprot:GEZU01008333.1.p1 GENE.GEZU01008333.1~~GEZU01008333.1.p1  ORF type:complete len:392 (+),score=113.74 GEZU01008333.1:249-1424(+)